MLFDCCHTYLEFGQIVAAFCSTTIMEPFMNFKSYADTAQTDNSVGKQSVNYPLVRQTSVYSLTFEEFQHTLGGGGVSKDFGSMNMEDLLKSIWTAEEGQTVAPSMAVGRNAPDGNFQSQGSLTLPRTLSQKTVDEVWKDVLKETVGAKDGNANGVSNLGQREPTLGEVTLEEFLFKAGVVREDTQPSARPSSTGIFSLPQASVNSSGLTIGFQQSTPNHGLLGNQLGNVINSPNLGINMSGGMSTQQLPQQSQLQLQPLFPKQTTVTFSSPSQHGNNAQLTNSATEGPTLVTSNGLNNSIPGGGIAMGGLRNGAAGAAVGSPASHIHPDAIVKSSTDTPSVSPSPYNFGEGGRGRRAAGSLEKVVERRRKRMIKNRESAARSRARKQAYTLELEAEVAKLKEMNEELRKKQEEFMKMQKNQNLETMSKPQGAAQGRCLRRTVTGPW